MSVSVQVCQVRDVEEGCALKVKTNDLTLAVFNLNGAFYVIDDQCTHGPGSLSEGFIEDCIVECDFHNGRFDVRTGAVVGPPCIVPVRTYKVTVEGEKVLIELAG
jgi:nitrite reductase/ring-hydroxylating ferredoxin subunit